MESYIIEDTDEFLIHHGVKGQKWGVRKKAYEPVGRTIHVASDKKSANGVSKIQQRVKDRISGRKTSKLKKREEKAKAKLRKINAQKKVEALEQQVSIEERKQAILKKRSGKEIYKNADLFTTDELKEATRRLEFEKKLREIDPPVKTKGQRFLEKTEATGKAIGTVTDTLKKSAEMYDTLNKYLGDGKTLAEKMNPKTEKKD